MVRVGFWQPPEVKPAASITNRLSTSCDLLELVEDGLALVLPHARHPHLVDPVAGDAIGNRVGLDVLRSGGLEHLRRRLRHVRGHGLLVVAPRAGDLEGRDAEHVDGVLVDLDEVLPSRQHFAEAGEADRGHGIDQRLLEGVAEAGRVPVEGGLTPALESVAPEELRVLRALQGVAEADDVDAVGPARTVERGLAAQLGELSAGPARDPEMVHEVVAERPTRVAQAVRMLAGRRVEEQARRLQGLRPDEDGAAVDLFRLAGHAVDVEDALGPVLLGIHEHLVGHRVRDEGAVAGGEGVGHGRERRVEVRLRDAALLAGPAVVAGLAAVDGLRQVGRAAQGQGPAQLVLDACLHLPLGAGEAHGRVELAVGQLVDALEHPRDADVLLDLVVVGGEVGVGKRPVLTEAVEGRGLEVEVGVAVALPAPDVRAASDHAGPPLPAEGLPFGGGIGLLEVVHEPVVVVLATRVAILLLGPRLADQVVGLVAIGQLEGGLVLGVVGGREHAARVEKPDLEAGFGQAAWPPSRRRLPNRSRARRMSGPPDLPRDLLGTYRRVRLSRGIATVNAYNLSRS